MPVRVVDGPVGVLWRVGRAPDPLAWPPLAFAGGGRYDDQEGRFAVLYAAAQRRGAFVETLAPFRPAVAELARARALPPGDAGDEMPPAGFVPDAYFRRVIASFRVASHRRWLDLRAPETHQALRSELAESLVALGYGHGFVWGDVVGHDHRLTRVIAGWAHGSGFHGVIYRSAHDARLDCWAIFDGVPLTPVGTVVPIDAADPDLVAVAALFELAIP